MTPHAHPAPHAQHAPDAVPDTGPAPRAAPVLRDAEPADEAALLALFEAAEDWFLAATGLPSAPGDVQSLWYALPEGANDEVAAGKRILVAEADGAVVGVVDAVLGHPGPGAATVGLFLLAPRARRAGLGSALAAQLAERARREGITEVTATVPAGWTPGEAFLTALGGTLGAAYPAAGAVGNRRSGPGERAVALRRAVLRLDGPRVPGRP
jgi:GNAT superfamily N-acetyltransferase